MAEKTNEQKAQEKLNKHLADISKIEADLNSAVEEYNRAKAEVNKIEEEFEARGESPLGDWRYKQAQKKVERTAEKCSNLQEKKQKQENATQKFETKLANAKIKDQEELVWKKREEELISQGKGRTEAWFQVQLEKLGHNFKGFMGKVISPLGETLQILSGITPMLVNAWLGNDKSEKEEEKEREEEVNEVVDEIEEVADARIENINTQERQIDSMQDLVTQLNDTQDIDDSIERVESVSEELQEIQNLELPPPVAPMLALPPPLDNSDYIELVSSPIIEQINNRDQHYAKIYARAQDFGVQATQKVQESRKNHEDISSLISDIGSTIVQAVFQSEMDIIEALTGDDTLNDLLVPITELASSATDTQIQLRELEERNTENLILIDNGLEQSLEVQDAKMNALALGQEASNELAVDQVEKELIEFKLSQEELDLMEMQLADQQLEVEQSRLSGMASKAANKFIEKATSADVIGRIAAAGLYALSDKMIHFADSDLDLPSISDIATEENEVVPESSTVPSSNPEVASAPSAPTTSAPTPTTSVSTNSSTSEGRIVVASVTQPMMEIEADIATSEMNRLATKGV